MRANNERSILALIQSFLCASRCAPRRLVCSLRAQTRCASVTFCLAAMCAMLIWGLAGMSHAQSAAGPCTYFVDNSSTGCGGGGCSDGNAGTTLATAWLTTTQLATHSFTAGQTACFVGQANPNTTNGGIWRAVYAHTGVGTGWGPTSQVTVTSMDPSKPAILTSAQCYGAASGLCTGSSAVTWHQCTNNDALCNNSTNGNITNVYEYTRPAAVKGAIYVDDPDVINGTTLWGVPSKMLYLASGLPGAGSTRANNAFQGDMTAGTFYDDGTHLYIWMGDNSNPGNHIIEAPTVGAATGIIHNYGPTNDYNYFSYLKLIYEATDGIDTEQASAVTAMHVWYDHIQGGGFGAGPVTNAGGMYAALLLTAATNGAQPGGGVTASEVHLTNSIANWCGSHNCFSTDGVGPGGFVYYINNMAGTAEHSQFDIKCAGGTNTITNNYAHDSWTGTVLGSDPTQNGQNSYYSEPDWTACTGGTLTYTGNIGYNVNIGIYCNSPNNLSGGTVTKTCKEYNNTMILNAGLTVTNPCYFFSNFTGSTLTGDTENNICVMQTSTSEGFAWSSGGTNNVTEQYNLFFNQAGGVNQNRWGNTDYTTLANWKSNCGGGSGCGVSDLWQVNPVGEPNAAISLSGSSPAIGAGNSAVGTGSTMGAVPVSATPGGITGQRGAGSR